MRYISIILLVLVYGCAQVVAPNGGSKDITPPTAIEHKTSPKNFSTNFKASEISIVFNEFFKLNSPSQNIIITPSLTKKTEYKIKGKKLIIQLNNELEPNTTYSINFGEAISDITENNILKNFKYVFSTGAFLDSLKIQGQLTDALTNNTVADSWVMLYKEHYDSIPLKEKPFYFSKTNKNGQFEISNIKEGNYKLFALKDDNNNFLYDNPTEDIAFSDSLINIQHDSLPSIKLVSFNEKKEKFFIKSATFSRNNSVSLVFSKPLHFPPKVVNDYLNEFAFKPKSDSCIWTLKDTALTKLVIPIFIEEYEFEDTITVKRKGHLMPFTIKSSKAKYAINDTINIHVNYPIKSIDTSLISILLDSTNVKYSISSTQNNLNILLDKKIEGKYSIVLLPNAITSIYSTKNDSLTAQFELLNNEQYSALNLSLEVDSLYTSSLIVELYDSKNSLIKSELLPFGKNQIHYTMLMPGEYSAKIIFDENNNGEWDTGNYFNNIQPEKVLLFSKKILLRANWEVNETWVVKEAY